MKKILFAALLLTVTYPSLYAQKEYKLEKTSGKLLLANIPHVFIEGYDGREVIIRTHNPVSDNSQKELTEKKEDARAKGLSPLNNNGFDNTGMGLNISESGTDATVSAIGRAQENYYTIKLPNTVSLTIYNNRARYFSQSDSTPIVVQNLKSEIEISSQFGNCRIINASGPVGIKTLSGNIEILADNAIKQPITAYSVNGIIDLKVPEKANATLEMVSLNGTIYADQSLPLTSKTSTANSKQEHTIMADKIVVENGEITGYGIKLGKTDSLNNAARELARRATEMSLTGSTLSISGGSQFAGTLNSGGTKIMLRTTYGNIYLRK